MAVCQACGGKGGAELFDVWNTCKKCNGTGQIPDTQPSYSSDDDDDDLDDIDDVNEAMEEVHSSLAEVVANSYSKKDVARGCSILSELYIKRYNFNAALNKNDEAEKDLKYAIHLASPKQLVDLSRQGANTKMNTDALFKHAYAEDNAKHHAVAAYLYEKSMEMGDIYAQRNLGAHYHNGSGVPQDYEKAFELYQKPAEQGDACAQRNIGTLYRTGKGVKKNYAKAKEWLNKAAIQGYEDAKEGLQQLEKEFPDEQAKIDKAIGEALNLWNAGERKKAIKIWESLESNATAQCNLGSCYENGEGNLSKNYYKAVELYRKAAEQGDANAQNNLANCYYNGNGVSRDYRKAFELYSKSAEQGNSFGLNGLGICYENGDGVSRNYRDAYESYLESAAKGNSGGQVNLGRCYMYGNGIEKDYKRAGEWLNKALAQGNNDAKENLKTLKRLKNKKYEKFIGIGIVLGIIGISVLVNLDSIRSTIASFTEEEKPVATQQQATVILIAKNNTAIRSKPENNSTLVKAVIKGEKLNLTGKLEKGWFPVQSGNAKGYVNALHVEVKK